MLSAINIKKSYNNKIILNNISISLQPLDKIGLLGKNGSGKTTLLKILAGQEIPDEGKIDCVATISYIPQSPDFKKQTIEDYIKDCEYLTLYKIMAQIGFVTADQSLLCEALSGGQQAKLVIAKMLSEKFIPEFFLMDEPTNNLDIQGLEWLERYIMKYTGGLIVTSHDRYFLDRICSKIIELKDTNIELYGGNYSDYKKQIEIKNQAYLNRYLTQQKMIKKSISTITKLKNTSLLYENMFTSRHPFQKKKASKSARSAIVKQKKLEQLLNSRQMLEKPDNYQKYKLDFTEANPRSKLILSVNHLSFSYGKHKILNNISFDIYGSDKIWIRGKNGSGKTTLLNLINNKLYSDSGKIKFGSNLKVGYLSQSLAFNENNTGIGELVNVCDSKDVCYRMATHLQLFEKDINMSINKFSLGQKIKLAFVKLLLMKCNLLILDEPTNHLDIETREDIENALILYKGALLVVSHDRYFIEKLKITKIIDLDYI